MKGRRYLQLETERIFSKTWQLAGRADQVAESGQFFTTEIAGESVVILCDGATLRGYHEDCLHRAGPANAGFEPERMHFVTSKEWRVARSCPPACPPARMPGLPRERLLSESATRR